MSWVPVRSLASILSIAAFALAGCYDPKPRFNAPCSPAGECPEGQQCSGGICVDPDDDRDASPPVNDTNDVDAPLVDAAIDAPPDAPPAVAPQFHGLSFQRSGNASATVPSPANVQTGDLLIIHASMDSEAFGSIVPPPGWTRIAGLQGPSDNFSTAVYWRIAQDPNASYTFSYPTSLNYTYLMAFGDVDPATPIGDVNTITTPNSTTTRVPSADAVVPRSLLVALVTQDIGNMAYMPLPNMTELYNIGGGITLLAAYAEVPVGATGTRTTTTSSPGPSIGVAVIVVPRP